MVNLVFLCLFCLVALLIVLICLVVFEFRFGSFEFGLVSGVVLV